MRNLNRQLRDLRERKKELQQSIYDYLEETEQPGIKGPDGTIITQSTQKRTKPKKKKDKINDGVKVLTKAGINVLDAPKILERLQEAMKGKQREIPSIKITKIKKKK